MNPFESHLNPFESQMNPIESPKNIGKTYLCNFCGKIYSTNSNLHKHLKTCKVKKEYDESERLKDLEIERLKDEVNKLKSQQSNTTNNININTNKLETHSTWSGVNSINYKYNLFFLPYPNWFTKPFIFSFFSKL